MNKKIILTGVASFVIALSSFQNANAREQIRIVGSSTVYPFSAVVAEEFGSKTKFKTPIVEATGTGGGIKLFCSGVGDNTPDITGASRIIKKSEIELCKKNGVSEPMEIKVGLDGIVLANSTNAVLYNFSRKQIFLALAKKVPVNGKLVDNPYKKWSEIDSSLPDLDIEIYGPPPTSGTRDAFVDLVMKASCVGMSEFKASFPDKKIRKKACSVMREDGIFIEAGENDNLIIQKLVANERALGIFGFSFLDQNADKVQGSVIEGVEPTFENVSTGAYGVSRPLLIYVKNEHLKKIAGLKKFVQNFISSDAVGEEGYLTFKGLIPLPEAQRKMQEDRVGK